MYYTLKPPIYKKEQIKFKSTPYKSNEEFEKELFKLKDASHTTNPVLKEYTHLYVEPLYQSNQVYKEESFNKKEYGEIEFYNWLKKQKDPFIAVLAEIVNAPKMSKSIEEFRPHVKELDTITIDDYIKIKKWGTKKGEWLKQLKKKYGNYILKFLNLTVS
jgi:hypothetical protein